MSGRTILLLGGANVALFCVRDWDASHLLYHAVAIIVVLAAIPFMRSPVARTLQAMVLGASLAEILLRAGPLAARARHALTPGWVALAALYVSGFALMFWYEHSGRRPTLSGSASPSRRRGSRP